MKKVVLLLMVFILSAGNTYPVLALEDTKGTVYGSSVDELILLQIFNGYEDGSFRPENTLTRGEFCTIVVRILGLNELAANAKDTQVFSDVPNSHWASGYINTAAGLKLINGYGDGLFGPDDAITGIQSAKILLSMTGYEQFSMENGGYPQGFLNSALTLGMTKNVSSNMMMPINRGNTAMLIRNAMDVRIVDSTGKLLDETLKTNLYDLRGITKRSGIVTGNNFTQIDSVTRINKNSIIIDGVIYNDGGADYSDFIGFKVDYYVQSEDKSLNGTNTVYAMTKRSENMEITINSDDIVHVSNNAVEYYNYSTNKTEILKISDLVNTLYNGKYFKEAVAADWEIENGQLVLIDNNDDGVYDLVKIHSPQIYMVDSADVKDMRINLKVFSSAGESRFMGKTYIDMADPDIFVEIKSTEGEAIAPEKLQKNQIIAVFASKDGKYVEIIPTDAQVTGEVQEIGSDKEAVVEGNKYKIASNMNGVALVELKIGEKGVFWLDIYGRITAKSTENEGLGATVQTVDKDLITGYVLAGVKTGAISHDVQLKILNNLKDGTREERIFSLADKVMLNGVEMSNSSALDTMVQDGINRPATFDLNHKNQINAISMFKSIGTATLKTYYSANKSFDNLYYLDKDSIIYFVDINDIANVLGIKGAALVNDGRYNVQIFDPDSDTFFAKDRVFVIHTDLRNSNVKSGDYPMLVSNISSYQKDSVIRYRVTGLVGADVLTYDLDERINKTVSKMGNGSLISFALSQTGEMDQIKKLADIPPESSYRSGIGGINEQVYGKAHDVQSNSDYTSCLLTVSYDKSGASSNVTYDVTNKPVYIYYRSGRTEIGTLNDISPAEYVGNNDASNVFISVNNFDVKVVVVIK